MFVLKKLLSLLLVLAAAAQQQQSYQAYPIQGFGLRHEQRQEQTRPAEYNYSYDVRDDRTGDRKSQQESRSGDVVRGSYSILDADGSTRTVEYTVDPQSGFNAVVRRDGDQISLPNTESRDFPDNGNVNHSRRPSSRNNLHRNSHQSGRYVRPTLATRLAQDARTGYVVDLHSGFGTASQARTQSNQLFAQTSSTRENTIQRQPMSQSRYNQFEVAAPAILRSQPEVQQISPRSHYHTSHMPNHYSTTPIHFQSLLRDNYNARSNLVPTLNRLTNTPNSQVEVRQPSAILPDSNTSSRPVNVDINRLEGNEQAIYQPIEATRMYHQNRDITVDNTNSIQSGGEQSNYNSINTDIVYQQNNQYLHQHEGISGTTAPSGHTPSQISNVIQESNRTNHVFYLQPNQFGARISANNRQTQTETRLTSTTDDSIVTNVQEISDPNHTVFHPDESSNAEVHPQIYPGNPDFSSNVPEPTQRYLYPASTFPLDTLTHDHFVTGDSLGTHNELPLIAIDNYNTHVEPQTDAVQISPIHYSHPVHLIH